MLNAPRVVGGQDPAPRALYGARDLIVIDAGTARGVQISQRYFVRRAMRAVGGPSGSEVHRLRYRGLRPVGGDRRAVDATDTRGAGSVSGLGAPPSRARERLHESVREDLPDLQTRVGSLRQFPGCFSVVTTASHNRNLFDLFRNITCVAAGRSVPQAPRVCDVYRNTYWHSLGAVVSWSGVCVSRE